MTEPAGATEVGMHLADSLGAAGVPYALGGALAYGVWGIPRGTLDVDLNVFVHPNELPHALDVLSAAGVRFDREEAERESLDGGQFVGWFGSMRIDVYIPSIGFSWEAARTRAQAEPFGRAAWFLSAESLCVFKLMYFRTKDIGDLERMIATQGKRLDAPYVRRWIVDIMGDDDVRVKEWDRLVALFWK